MIKNTLVVCKNTFTEALRQPIYIVIILATQIIFLFTPSLVMFTIREDNKLMWDIGLSNLLVAGLFIAVFSASTVVTDEIDRKTALTVISKTVSRPAFVLGKFLGVTGAVLLAQYLLILVYFMTVRHGVLESASDEPDYTVITFSFASSFIAIALAALGNYFYKWRFGSSTVFLSTILYSLSILILCFIDRDWKYNPANNQFKAHLIGPVILVMLASIMFCSISVTAAMRFNMVTTLIICAVAFLLGTMVHYKLGPVAMKPYKEITEQKTAALKQADPTTDDSKLSVDVSLGDYVKYFTEKPKQILPTTCAWGGLAVIPSINLYVVTDGVYDEPKPLHELSAEKQEKELQKRSMRSKYIVRTAVYTMAYTLGALTIAIMLFRKRDIG